MKRNMETR